MVTYPFSLTRYDAVYDLFEIGQFALYNPRRPNHRPLKLLVTPTLKELQKMVGIKLVREPSAPSAAIDEDVAAFNLSMIKETTKEKTVNWAEDSESSSPVKGDHILIPFSEYRRRVGDDSVDTASSTFDESAADKLASGQASQTSAHSLINADARESGYIYYDTDITGSDRTAGQGGISGLGNGRVFGNNGPGSKNRVRDVEEVFSSLYADSYESGHLYSYYDIATSGDIIAGWGGGGLSGSGNGRVFGNNGPGSN